MCPVSQVIKYLDNLLGSAPIYAAFRSFGCDQYLSYQWWYLIVSAFNYLSAYVFLKYVCKNTYGAILGAFVFTFSMALQGQITHVQTFPRYAVPLAFLFLVRFYQNSKTYNLLIALLLVVYQLYCGIYLGLLLAIPFGIYLTIITIQLVARRPNIITWAWLLKCFGSIFIVTSLTIPLILPYLNNRGEATVEHYQEILATLPNVFSYFTPFDHCLVWDFLRPLNAMKPGHWEHNLFMGGIATVCLAGCSLWLVIRWIKSRFKVNQLTPSIVLIFVGVATIIMFMRFGEISAYKWIYNLPGYSSMRLLTRIINIELLFAAVTVSLVFTKIFNNKSKYGWLVFVAVLGQLTIDNYCVWGKGVRTEVSKAKHRTETLTTAFNKIPSGAVVSYEPVNLLPSAATCQIDAMIASQSFNVKILNGYSGGCPGDFGPFWNLPNSETRNNWLKYRNLGTDSLYIISGDGEVNLIVNE